MAVQLKLGTDGQWEEKGRDYVTKRDSSGHVTSRDLPHAPLTIEQRIFNFVWSYGGAVTRREIAKALGLSSTGWLNSKIDGLVSTGYLRRTAYQYRQNMSTYKYEVNQ